MRVRKTTKRRGKTSKSAAARPTSTAVSKRAAIVRNGANQAVRLPQDFRFPDGMKEVRIRKKGDILLISPVRPDWASFFSMAIDVPEDFLELRGEPPQSRELL